ncbi:IS110 family transposase [Sinorhizobium medicae]|uniref:IS110 family transposase n=2 Tax=Sinorhizobium medicae TaxID=110321 RepID=UPI0003646D0B|nr:IS110 family transposase [Sinorhizobium medicae]
MIHPDVIGCDIAKAHLDFFDSGLERHFRIDNTPAAISAWLDGLDGRGVHIVFEATGRYDRQLRIALETRELPYSRVNPARARDFAKAIGLLAKTDAIDARLLARMGQSLPLSTQAPDDPARHVLARLHTRRDQLVAMRQQERTRLHETEGIERDSAESHMAWLDAEGARIEMACRDVLKAEKTLQEQEARLRSIPGIGPVAALTLIAHMPELGNRSAKAIAALAGLAPFNVDSGTSRGKRHIRGGRKRIRDALYMAALTASRMPRAFKSHADQMKEAGKPFKVVIIALARKLLAIANAIIRDKTTFRRTT